MRRTGTPMARFVRKIRRGLKWLTTNDQWFLAIRATGGALPTPDGGAWRFVYPPRDRFWADPNLVTSQEDTWLFVEDFRYARGRGVISCCKLKEGRLEGLPVPVLEEPHHLSYPFVFEHEDTYFMLVESHESRTVQLYRASDFPERWVPEVTILDDVIAFDPTLMRKDGKWWLFATPASLPRPHYEELHLFGATSLAGPWEPHQDNPVVRDAAVARPAGRLFTHDDALVRPSQDCSASYGAALVFNRIDRLDDDGYREVTIHRFGASDLPQSRATHTYARAGGFEVVDGLRSIARLPSFSSTRRNRTAPPRS